MQTTLLRTALTHEPVRAAPIPGRTIPIVHTPR